MMLTLPLAGCLGGEEVEPEAPAPTVWDFERPELTWYHMPGAVDAWGNDSLVLEGRNAPFHAMGTYYGIGMSTFEPTMGITESQTLFMSS
ncbi:MAG TPA: hypothetical protein D7I05_07370, partial [Candidatus Poseidoniales archaeon]